MKLNTLKIVHAICVTLKVINGWPCISESLQWAEGCPLYLMGQYTALQVGLHWQLNSRKPLFYPRLP